jgi:hypothetical protein
MKILKFIFRKSIITAVFRAIGKICTVWTNGCSDLYSGKTSEFGRCNDGGIDFFFGPPMCNTALMNY